MGYEIAKLFLAKNYEVVCLTRHKPDLVVSHIETDLTNEDSISHTIKEIESKYPDFSLFISCAAVGHIETIEAMSREKSKEMFDVNVF
ncbi:MAG: SDR family NAD(P)-dependent oxidoreductase [bacterium]